MENEIWKDIPGYKKYKISANGSVFSRITSKILKLNITKNGYATVQLFKNRVGKRLLVHRLVADAFLPNPKKLPQVNHRDENKLNNSVNNLEWCTAKENMNYGKMAKLRHKLIDYSTKERKLIAIENGKKANKPVLQFTKNGDFIKRFKSIKEAGESTKSNASHIAECCKGHRYKSVGGYKWKYEERA